VIINLNTLGFAAALEDATAKRWKWDTRRRIQRKKIEMVRLNKYSIF